MTVIDLQKLEKALPPKRSVLCLGNFDGVHVGHRALILETIKQKELLKAQYPDIKCGAWFFRRAPLDIISGRNTPLITDFSQKLDVFSALGLDYAFVYEYEDIGALSPESFISDVLKKDCGCVYAVCGYNFKFGVNASGDANLLSKLMDGKVSVVDRVTLGQKNVCSSEIRRLIADGNISEVNSLLGRNYSIHGVILHGKMLGRKLGIPTINQKIPSDLAILKKGIYISRALVGQKWLPSVSNIGVRPSVENTDEINCETHIIGFDGDLYGKDVKVEFLHRLRNEIKFESIDMLKAQVNRDIEEAKAYFLGKQEA